MTLFNKKEVG